MCGGGRRAPEPDTRAQEESLRLQREQMAMQQEQMALQQQQFKEQLAISQAKPPQAPEVSAAVAASALERRTANVAASAVEMPSAMGGVASGTTSMGVQQARTGRGRRTFRTDYGVNVAGGVGGLSIPAA